MSTRILAGAERYRREPERRVTPAGDMVAKANAVSIFDVLTDFFGIDVPREGTSFKSMCPFYFEHPDGGMDKGFRTYPASNSAYCFVQHGLLNPVRLICVRNDVKAPEAARIVLTRYDLLKPRYYAERMRELLVAHERDRHDLGQAAYAVEALHLALATSPAYAERQFDDDMVAALEERLEALDAVMADHSSNVTHVRAWYRDAKAALLTLVTLD